MGTYRSSHRVHINGRAAPPRLSRPLLAAPLCTTRTPTPVFALVVALNPVPHPPSRSDLWFQSCAHLVAVVRLALAFVLLALVLHNRSSRARVALLRVAAEAGSSLVCTPVTSGQAAAEQ